MLSFFYFGRDLKVQNIEIQSNFGTLENHGKSLEGLDPLPALPGGWCQAEKTQVSGQIVFFAEE